MSQYTRRSITLNVSLVLGIVLLFQTHIITIVNK